MAKTIRRMTEELYKDARRAGIDESWANYESDINEFISSISKLILEAVGGDMKQIFYPPSGQEYIDGYNQAKAEIRQKISEILK